MRGAAAGALWMIGASDVQQVRAQLCFFADPDHLGDFLAGLFGLAREVVQRHRDLVLSIDQLLVAFADEEFLTALPSLRLAFTYFTPREKHHMALTLLEALGLGLAALDDRAEPNYDRGLAERLVAWVRTGDTGEELPDRHTTAFRTVALIDAANLIPNRFEERYGHPNDGNHWLS